MIGKVWNSSKSKISNSAAAIQSTKTWDITAVQRVQNIEDLPQAPASAFRKRPVKLTYDKNEFWMFRLPSEDHWLLSGFDREDLFGKRKGITHSPHIQAQTDLDSNLLWGIAALTLVMTGFEVKNHAQFKALRENYRDGDKGKFVAEDFI